MSRILGIIEYKAKPKLACPFKAIQVIEANKDLIEVFCKDVFRGFAFHNGAGFIGFGLGEGGDFYH